MLRPDQHAAWGQLFMRALPALCARFECALARITYVGGSSMRLIRWIQGAWRQLADRWQYDLKVVEITGNAAPSDLSNKQLARLSSGGQAWAAVMLCPCGCGDDIELMLLKAVDPHWDLDIDRGLPTLCLLYTSRCV